MSAARLRLLLPLAVATCVASATVAWAASPKDAAAWAQLTPAQKQALSPLQRDWAQIDAPRRAKWLEVAARFPTLPADERARLQERMTDWARMTPSERTRARMQFQEAKQVSPDDRQAKWQAYQALTETERQALTQRAKPVAKPPAGPAPATTTGPVPVAEVGKKNLVQTTPTPRARAATQAAQQNRPGATTTPMTARALPPLHNQAGMPKIAATPGFVDPATLLPKRGPQGAAVRSAAIYSEPANRP